MVGSMAKVLIFGIVFGVAGGLITYAIFTPRPQGRQLLKHLFISVFGSVSGVMGVYAVLHVIRAYSPNQ
jgi:hypothetical protein